MKLPQIKMPGWWRPWFKYQALLVGALIANLWSAYNSYPSITSSIGMFCAGGSFMGVLLFSSLWRMSDLNKELRHMYHQLGQLQTDQIGAEIGAHIAASMKGEEIKPPTRH